MPEGKPTKKEVSKRKATARQNRKAKAQERKASSKKEEKENPITLEILDDGEYVFHGRSLNPTRDKNRALAPLNKQIWSRGQQLSLLPTEEQKTLIHKTNGCARVVKNDYRDKRIEQFETERTTLSVATYKKEFLPKLKEENPWLREVDKFALEAAVEHIDAAYKHFFEGNADFPKKASKYKPSGNRYTTKYTNGNIALVLGDDNIPYLKIPKLGLVRFVIPAGKVFENVVPPGTRITSLTVIKDGSNYLASLSLESVVNIPEKIQTFSRLQIIAMDMGLRKFCDYGHGDGEYHHVENPRWINKHEKRLRRFQKSLARKQYDQKTHKGSRNWEKAKAKIAKEQRKIKNQRKDFHHKLSREIADSCDVFVCETLNVKSMVQNRHLAKQISSVGWSQFLSFVKYKIEAKGGIFLKVDRWFPSSKLCSCGYKNTELKNQLVWKCPHCHNVNERDDNAVDNLAREGIRILTEQGIKFVA